MCKIRLCGNRRLTFEWAPSASPKTTPLLPHVNDLFPESRRTFVCVLWLHVSAHRTHFSKHFSNLLHILGSIYAHSWISFSPIWGNLSSVILMKGSLIHWPIHSFVENLAASFSQTSYDGISWQLLTFFRWLSINLRFSRGSVPTVSVALWKSLIYLLLFLLLLFF